MHKCRCLLVFREVSEKGGRFLCQRISSKTTQFVFSHVFNKRIISKAMLGEMLAGSTENCPSLNVISRFKVAGSWVGTPLRALLKS